MMEDKVRKFSAVCTDSVPDLLLLNMKHSRAGATHLLLFSDFQETLFQLCLACVLLKPLYQLPAGPGGHTKLNYRIKKIFPTATSKDWNFSSYNCIILS